MIRRGGYSDGFIQRFGQFPALPSKTPGRLRIWIQAVSVGEIEAIGPLLQGLKSSGQTEVVLTTTRARATASLKIVIKNSASASDFFP